MSAGRPPPERRTFEPARSGAANSFKPRPIVLRDSGRPRHGAHAPVAGRARLRRREQTPLPFVQTHPHRVETVANRCFINHPAVIAISSNLGNPHPAARQRSAHIQVDSIVLRRRLSPIFRLKPRTKHFSLFLRRLRPRQRGSPKGALDDFRGFTTLLEPASGSSRLPEATKPTLRFAPIGASCRQVGELLR